MFQMIPVEGSNMVAGFGISGTGKTLAVVIKGDKLKSGEVKPDVLYKFRPANVAELFAQMKAADSKGRFFIANIKPLPVKSKTVLS
jgi:hypothetical protein